MANSNPKKLYVDILNFSDRFFKLSNTTNCWQVISAVPFDEVTKFVTAAENGGWEIKGFIDARIQTAETLDKWRKRREEEIIKGIKRPMHGMQFILGDLFKECGVDVRYSLDADNDDTVASYAESDGASVLSRDHDFFRYQSSTFQVFANYEIDENGTLHLFEGKCHLSENDQNSRQLISPPPQTFSHAQYGGFSDVFKGKRYQRGTPTGLIKQLGNPHFTTRKLRQALYAKWQIQGTIEEELPEWKHENSEIVWNIEHVPSDDTLAHLLEEPVIAFRTLFPLIQELSSNISRPEFGNYVYATAAVCFEICAAAMDVPLISLLRLHGESIMEEYSILHQDVADNSSADIGYQFECVSCHRLSNLRQPEVDWFLSKGFTLPKRCKQCRQKNKR